MATDSSVQTPDGAFDASLSTVLNMDREALLKARKNYGESWCKRGGVGAYMMLVRKVDRLENYLSQSHPGVEKYDILTAAEKDQRPEGIIDDIRDARRYLALIEAKLIERNVCPGYLKKDAVASFVDMSNGTSYTGVIGMKTNGEVVPLTSDDAPSVWKCSVCGQYTRNQILNLNGVLFHDMRGCSGKLLAMRNDGSLVEQENIKAQDLDKAKGVAKFNELQKVKAEPKPVDYKALLQRYIKHIVGCVGSAFIEASSGGKAGYLSQSTQHDLNAVYTECDCGADDDTPNASTLHPK